MALNVLAPTLVKSDDSKDTVDEELEQVLHHSPKYHIKILLGDINAKLREDIFKLTAGNGSFHEVSNGNGVRVVNFATKEKSGC